MPGMRFVLPMCLVGLVGCDLVQGASETQEPDVLPASAVAPEVEPAEPPRNINPKKKMVKNVVHAVKSAVTKPVGRFLYCSARLVLASIGGDVYNNMVAASTIA